MLRQIPSIFLPEKWSEYEATLRGEHHTYNQCETWNNIFRYLVVIARPSVIEAGRQKL